MSTIKAYTTYNERTGAHLSRKFEIVAVLPKVGETFNLGDYKCTGINEVQIDCEQGNDRVYQFNYFVATMKSCDPDDEDTWNDYFAIEKEKEC